MSHHGEDHSPPGEKSPTGSDGGNVKLPRSSDVDKVPPDNYHRSRSRSPRRPYFRPYGYRPPQNMDEMSELIFTLKDDLCSLKNQSGSSRRARRSTSFSRSRSRERTRYRSRTRSRSRDRRFSDRDRRSRGRRSRSRSRYRSPSPRRRRHRSKSPARQRAPSHPISDSEDSAPSGLEEEGSSEPKVTEEGALQDDPNNPFCGYVKQIACDTKVGESIEPWVAQFVEKSLSSPPAKDVLQEICDRYKRPENVVNLQVPSVENSVWLAISAKARTKDNLRQKHQETFIKMMIALTSATEELNRKVIALQREGRGKGDWLLHPLAKLKDAIMIGGFHNMQEIIKRRRYDLEYFMPEKYRRLCTDFNAFPPTPTALLGENIEDAIKQMDVTNKLSQKLDKNSQQNKGPNTNSGGYSYNNKRPNTNYKKGNGSKNRKNVKNNKNYDGQSSGNKSGHYPRGGNDGSKKRDQDFHKGGPPKPN